MNETLIASWTLNGILFLISVYLGKVSIEKSFEHSGEMSRYIPILVHNEKDFGCSCFTEIAEIYDDYKRISKQVYLDMPKAEAKRKFTYKNKALYYIVIDDRKRKLKRVQKRLVLLAEEQVDRVTKLFEKHYREDVELVRKDLMEKEGGY